MDLLTRKKALISICLLGAVVLTADEDTADETVRNPQDRADDVQDLISTESTAKKDPTPASTQTEKQSNQASELKPLTLRERIRAHANIDLPQDI